MEFNEDEKTKADGFVRRLIENPSLSHFTLLQREEQVLQFLSVNAKQLYPTLSSRAFFGPREWEDIWGLLVSSIYNVINEELLPELEAVAHNIDTGFFDLMGDKSADYSGAEDSVRKLAVQSCTNEQARRILTGAYSAIKYELPRRYLGEIYRRKKYIHFEITKVERLRFGAQEAENMVVLTMLFKPLVYLFTPQGTQMKNTANGYVFLSQFTRNVASVLIEKNPSVPEQVFLSAMNSNASFADDNRLEATARLCNILTAMSRNYRPDMVPDRGADTAQKSWISVARRNYRFYGYDIKMLDELYNIAAENGW